jgi:hypothetical protein
MNLGKKKKTVNHPEIVKPRTMPKPIEVPDWPQRTNIPVPVEVPLPGRVINV